MNLVNTIRELDPDLIFVEKGDYFTSFGAANYAYGFIDCILVLENKKDETNVF